jgi:hypothetical protein
MQQRIILLLDEPGLSLHARAQEDLLRYFEQELKGDHQVLYTTHSRFMVDVKHFERVRIVQDKTIESDAALGPEEQAFEATPESGALKANALPGGWQRLAVRAVKGAGLAFIGAKRRPLIEAADGPGAGFKQEGQSGSISMTSTALCQRQIDGPGVSGYMAGATDMKCDSGGLWSLLPAFLQCAGAHVAKRFTRPLRTAARHRGGKIVICYLMFP